MAVGGLKTAAQPPEVLSIVLVDDSPDDRALVRHALGRSHPQVALREVSDPKGLEAALTEGGFDLLVTDYQLVWTNGLVVLREVKRRFPDVPVIMFTGTGNEEVAVQAMREGLDDYVVKSVRHLVRLSTSVQAALDQARQRRAMREAEETLFSLKQAVDTLPIGVTIVDVDGRIVYTNPAEAHIHGYSVEDLIGYEARRLVPKEYWRPMSLATLRELKPWRRERLNLRKDGTTFPAQLTSDVVRGGNGEPIAVVTTCEDISERKQIEQQLRRSAFYDALTGLPNRALLLDRLGRAIQRSRRRHDYRFAVLFLDLDRFKLVNDSLGHLAGDELLVETARRLERSLRPTDTVSRLGGDEFVILADDIRDVGDAVYIAERTRKELSLPLRLAGHEVFASTSIGIALSSPAYSDPEEVLRDADAAMYRAKARGRSRHEIFGDDMLADARGLLRLESELRRGLERGEFVVLYQPILSLHSRRTIGAEALVRWMHPQRGLLLPEDFIPVAEETGLISPLGEWVLQQACAQAQRWRRQGLADLTMAVNLSARQFRQGDLPQLILRTIGGSGLAPGALDLELTESTLMENLPDTVRSLEQLKALGVRLSIDDFGTGYSSLSYLKRFPVDTLKIDRSFVENIATDPRDGAITSAVIALGRSLKLSVIAEGVENEAQLAFLRKEGCDALQGFAYSPPLDAQDFEEVARRTFLE